LAKVSGGPDARDVEIAALLEEVEEVPLRGEEGVRLYLEGAGDLLDKVGDVVLAGGEGPPFVVFLWFLVFEVED
jgi:hypothetical protein